MQFIESRKKESDKAAWLEKRKGFVTGTDAGKIIGVSPWGGMFSVWLDKTGRSEPVAETPAMKAGKVMEATILKLYAEETDSVLEHMDGYDLRTCDEYPRIGASLDGWNHTLGIPVDAKNIRWKDEKWGDAYTDEFPEYYKAQLQVQMMVTGAKSAHLAVMFSGQDFFVYTMEYDGEMARKILEASDELWNFVATDTMPEADGAESTNEYIKKEFAVGKEDSEIEPTEELKELVKKLSDARKAKKEAEAEEERIGNRIKVIMGSSSIVKGLCTWKNEKSSVSVDWKSVAAEAMSEMSDEIRKDITDRHTSFKPGKRPLKITAKGL